MIPTNKNTQKRTMKKIQMGRNVKQVLYAIRAGFFIHLDLTILYLSLKILAQPFFRQVRKRKYFYFIMSNDILLFLVGLLAGALNAAAGGGSFITFPALIYAGVPAIQANASSTVALFPGGLASAWKFREYIIPFIGVSMLAMIVLTLAGGCIGALLLLYTSSAGFTLVVPWLLLIGSLAFAFGKKLGE